MLHVSSNHIYEFCSPYSLVLAIGTGVVFRNHLAPLYVLCIAQVVYLTDLHTVLAFLKLLSAFLSPEIKYPHM